MFPMSKEESLVTIENGGQVATWSRLQHNRTTNLGGRIIIWISTKSTYLNKLGLELCQAQVWLGVEVELMSR